MTIRSLSGVFVTALLPIAAGCTSTIGVPTSESAVIVGSIAPAGGAGKLATAWQASCPNVVVALNGDAVSIVLGSDCSFLIDDVEPAPNVELTIELPDLGVSGTIAIDDVAAAEFIEIQVQTGDDSLGLSVVRRATPEPGGTLPVLVSGNNVTIFLPAGTYDQSLTVEGNNFTLVGESNGDCNEDDWTVITGTVVVDGNNATFRNIRLTGSVEVRGNNADFINCCIGGELIIFGNNTEILGGGDDDDDDDDDDDKDDDDDD